MHSCFDLVFACFCFVILHQVILTFPRLESNPERVWLWRHVTKSSHTHKHVQHSTQVQAQSASILWAVLHIPLCIASSLYRLLLWVILIAHRSDSWSPEVYYTWLQSQQQRWPKLGLDRFFTLLWQFSRLSLVGPKSRQFWAFLGGRIFPVFGSFWKLFRKETPTTTRNTVLLYHVSYWMVLVSMLSAHSR